MYLPRWWLSPKKDAKTPKERVADDRPDVEDVVALLGASELGAPALLDSVTLRSRFLVSNPLLCSRPRRI